MWNTVKLEKIVNIDIGKTPSRNNPKYWDKEKKNSNVWVSIRDMSQLSGRYIDDSREYISNEGANLFKEVSKNTLIMSFKLSIGKLAITKINLRTNEAIAAFKIKDPNIICNEYLYYFLSSLNWDLIAGHDIKVKGKTLNKAKLKEISIVLPTLTEQKDITARLDKIFQEIEDDILLNKKKIDEFESLKLSIFKNMFNGPKIKLGDLYEITSSKRVFKSEWKTEGVPFFRAREIVKLANNKPFTNPIYISEEMFDLYSKKYGAPKEGDILITGVGTLGITYLVKQKDKFYFKDGNIIWLKKKHMDVNSNYIEAIFKSPYVKKQITNSIAATVGTLTIQKAKELLIPYPSQSIQDKIMEKMNNIFAYIYDYENTNKKNTQNYIALKKSFLKYYLQNKSA